MDAALLLGTVLFATSFTAVSSYVADGDGLGVAIFVCMFLVWLGYGVAAWMPHAQEVAYNLLDVVSKNVYGVFLVVYVVVLDSPSPPAPPP